MFSSEENAEGPTPQEMPCESGNVYLMYKWECKYHVVIVLKYRRKVLYGRIRGQSGRIIRQLCRQKGVALVEDNATSDHITWC